MTLGMATFPALTMEHPPRQDWMLCWQMEFASLNNIQLLPSALQQDLLFCPVDIPRERV